MVEVNLSSARRSAGTPRCRRRAAGARGRTSSASRPGASSTTATTDPSSTSPTAAAAARSVAARTVRGPGSTRVASAPKHWTCTDRRPAGPGLLVLGRGVDVDAATPAAGRPPRARGPRAGRTRPGSARDTARTASARRSVPASSELGDARGQARAVGGGERLGMAARHGQRHVQRRVRPDLPRHAAEESGMQQRQVDGADRATAARPAAAARPVAMPCSGPRPATGSSTTSTRGGRRAAPAPGPAPRGRARRPPRATTPTVRRSSVDPCHSRLRLGRCPSAPSGRRRGRCRRRVGYRRSPDGCTRRSRSPTIRAADRRRHGRPDWGSGRAGTARRRVQPAGRARAEREGPRVSQVEHANPDARGRSAAIADGLAFMARWSLRLALIGIGLALLWWLIARLWVIVMPVLLAPADRTRPGTRPPAWLRRRGAPAGAGGRRRVLGALVLLGLVVFFLATSITGGFRDRHQRRGRPPVDPELDRRAAAQHRLHAVRRAAPAGHERLQSSVTTIASGVLTGVGTLASLVVTTACSRWCSRSCSSRTATGSCRGCAASSGRAPAAT